MGSDDRSKLSFSERDRRRREGGGQDRAAPRRSKRETEKVEREALKTADKLFTSEKGGQRGKELAKAVRESHGSSASAVACQAYRDEVGVPAARDLLSVFLDSGDKSLRVEALDELLRQKDEGELELASSLKAQVRMLSEEFDDAIASRAEEILE